MSLANGRIAVHSPEVLSRIVAASPEGRPRALAWLLRSVGCRVGEAIRIALDDVGADEVRIPWLKRRGRPRWRTLPLQRARLQLGLLLATRPGRPGDGLETASQGGLNPSHSCGFSPPLLGITVRTAQRWLAAAAASVGIEGFHPHAFRHGFACEWLRRGGDLVRLQHWLGHSSLATTSLYLHSTPEDLRQEAERIGIGAMAPFPVHGPEPLQVVDHAASDR